MKSLRSFLARFCIGAKKVYNNPWNDNNFLFDPYRLDHIDWTVLLMAVEFFFMLRMKLSRLLTGYRLPECIFTKINIRNKKWRLCYSFNPRRNIISNHICHLSKGLDNYVSHYGNILFVKDFNSQPSENCLNDFCNLYNLSNLVKNQHVLKTLIIYLTSICFKQIFPNVFKALWRRKQGHHIFTNW